MKYCYLYFVNRFVLETDILKHTVLDVYVNSQIILFDSLVFFKQLKNNNGITALKMYLCVSKCFMKEKTIKKF